jgi:hypothetical protein
MSSSNASVPEGRSALGRASISWTLESLVASDLGDAFRALPHATAPTLVAPGVELRESRSASLSRQELGIRDAFFGGLSLWARPDSLVLANEFVHAHVAERRVAVSAAPKASPADVEAAATFGLHLALRDVGLFHLHGGAVTLDGRTWVVIGGTGAGKTTTCLSLAARGGTPLADDVVYLTEELTMVGLPLPFRARAATERMLDAAVVASAVRRTDEAVHLRVSDTTTSGRELQVGVLVVPEVTDAPATTVEVLPAERSLAALLGSSALTLLPNVGRRAQNLAVLSALVAGTPVLSLRLGRDALVDLRLPAERLQTILGEP